jgi:hypothetical protein
MTMLVTRLIERFKRIRRKGLRRADRPEPRRRRRQDPDWATLPGGSSPREAAKVPLERARELAD